MANIMPKIMLAQFIKAYLLILRWAIAVGGLNDLKWDVLGTFCKCPSSLNVASAPTQIYRRSPIQTRQAEGVRAVFSASK